MRPEPADDLLDRIARGDSEALGELAEVYAPYLRAVVRAQLSDRLRGKFDSGDVVQSVWVQVMRKVGREGWQVNDAGHLRALLVTIARRRLVARARLAARRPEGGDPGETADPRCVPPSEAAQAGDLWERMLDLTPADHHAVLRLRREGMQLADIAERTGLHEGTVRRILRKLSRDLALNDHPFTEQ